MIGCLNIQKRDFVSFFEMFIYMLLTVGPINPKEKILLYLVLIVINIKYIKFKINKLRLLLIMSLLVPMIFDIINISINTHYSMAGFAYLIPIVISIFFVRKYKFNFFCLMLEKVCYFASICSLIGMFFVVFFPLAISKLPVYNFYGRPVSTCIIFGAIHDHTGVSYLTRNCGIAFEPGAFQFVTNLGLFLCLKGLGDVNKGTKKMIRVLIYIFATLTTFSTTGFIILLCIFIFMAIKNKRNFISILLILFFSAGFLSEQLSYQVKKLATGNFNSRFNNTIYVIQNYWKNIFGIGSTGYDAIYSIDSSIGSWDMYTNLYLRFGIVCVILIIIYIYKLRKIDWVLVCIVFLSLSTESILGIIPIMFFYYMDRI